MRSDAPLSSVNVVLVMAYGSLVSLALYYCDAAVSNCCFCDDLTSNIITHFKWNFSWNRFCVYHDSVALTEICAVRLRREGNKCDIDLVESSESNQLSAFNELVSYIMQDLMNCITPRSLLLSLQQWICKHLTFIYIVLEFDCFYYDIQHEGTFWRMMMMLTHIKLRRLNFKSRERTLKGKIWEDSWLFFRCLFCCLFLSKDKLCDSPWSLGEVPIFLWVTMLLR